MQGNQIARRAAAATAALGLMFVLGCRQDMQDQPKFFPQRGTACPFRSPRPNVGNIRASGEESLESFRQASMTGRTEFN